jgi:hypothetical protein
MIQILMIIQTMSSDHDVFGLIQFLEEVEYLNLWWWQCTM